jgi:asparagine synthase (glutamine-hydrolysing)
MVSLPTADERQARVERLRELVERAVVETPGDGILLSGGLDTSIVATVAAARGRRLRAAMVSVRDAPAPDEAFALRLAARLGIGLHILRPSLGELAERMPEIIRVLDTFDPMELRNSIVTHLGLDRLITEGLRAVLTGDAADELFAGYSYMFNMPAEKLHLYIRHLNDVMCFTSLPLGEALGVGVGLPYLHPGVRSLALALDVHDLVAERNGRCFGKKILREAFADVLGEEVAWRVKTPIEHGSGSTGLAKFAADSVVDSEFENAREQVLRDEGVRLRDKEQYFYYRLYRGLFPPPREKAPAAKTCPDCQGPVPRADQTYCRICGAYPV